MHEESDLKGSTVGRERGVGSSASKVAKAKAKAEVEGLNSEEHKAQWSERYLAWQRRDQRPLRHNKTKRRK